jgi:hypothetical protein
VQAKRDRIHYFTMATPPKIDTRTLVLASSGQGFLQKKVPVRRQSADLADERFELLLSQMMTFMPYPAHLVANARPIPEAPPVMRAVFPDLKTGFEDMAVVRLCVDLLLLLGKFGEGEIWNTAGF